ncbi:MAG: N-acetylglucosamine-6-phosphate deacetylase [Erysipelotrichaceae bacterium]
MQSFILQSTRILTDNQLKTGKLVIKDGKIAEIIAFDDPRQSDLDVGDALIAPGLIDSHTHGFAGWSFTGVITPEEIVDLTQKYASYGVTSMLASSAFKGYRPIVEAIRNKNLKVKILGIHAEGPFLSSKQFGAAKPGTLFPAPNKNHALKMIEEAQGYLRMVTLAPEVEGNLELIDLFHEAGILIGAGHTDATRAELKRSEGKIDVFTHMGNAMKGIHHREIGTLGTALLSDVPCEIIADGLHLCRDMLELVFRLKPIDQLILISDSTAMAGLPVGQYDLPGGIIYVHADGLVTNEYGRISGSSRPIVKNIKVLLEMGISLPDIFRMGSYNPARQLGISDVTGTIEVGKFADLVVLDQDLSVALTMVEGNIVYRKGQAMKEYNPRTESLLQDPEFRGYYF